jgi:hypothetical protein
LLARRRLARAVTHYLCVETAPTVRLSLRHNQLSPHFGQRFVGRIALCTELRLGHYELCLGCASFRLLLTEGAQYLVQTSTPSLSLLGRFVASCGRLHQQHLQSLDLRRRYLGLFLVAGRAVFA